MTTPIPDLPGARLLAEVLGHWRQGCGGDWVCRTACVLGVTRVEPDDA